MFDYMKCIKTGCDVIVNNEFILHGDLMWLSGGILVLSGVAKSSNYTVVCDNKNYYYDFKVRDAFEIPGTGREYYCFVLQHISNVQKDFKAQIEEWESQEVCDFFK